MIYISFIVVFFNKKLYIELIEKIISFITAIISLVAAIISYKASKKEDKKLSSPLLGLLLLY